MSEEKGAEVKCCICKTNYLINSDEGGDQSACPKCVEEEKDRKHRLDNSKWNKFEAKF